MQMPTLAQVQARLFKVAGLAAACASVEGVADYLLIETQNPLQSYAGAGVLGLVIYKSWETVFSSNSRTKLATALSIALVGSTISGYTLYQSAQHVEYTQKVEQLQQQAQNEWEQSKATVIQANANFDTTIKQLTHQNTQLQAQNDLDAKQIETLLSTKSKNTPWQIDQVRKAIAARNDQITANLNKISTANSQKQTAPTAPQTVALPDLPFNYGMLARACLYDLLAPALLLLAAWSRQDQEHAQSQEVQALQTLIVQAKAVQQTLEAHCTTAKKLVVHAAVRTTDVQPTVQSVYNEPLASLSTELTEAQALDAIKQQLIEVDNKGRVTSKALEQVTGYKRRKLEDFRDKAVTLGLLTNLNGYYYYPDQVPQYAPNADQTNIIQLPLKEVRV